MNYWHLQMFQPAGRDKIQIDSKTMLRENSPVIGTAKWDDSQSRQFEGKQGISIQQGDIVLIREGKKCIALCRVKSDSFENSALTQKYYHELFRNVEVLEFYSDVNDFPKAQGTLERLVSKSTRSYKYLHELFTNFQNENRMEKVKNILEYKKQIILQGPPGTGKTYTAKNIAEQMIFGEVNDDKKEQGKRLKESEQYKIIQFHPSYTYEDFVRGIVVKSTGKEVEYVTKNKVLAEFAEKALKKHKESLHSGVIQNNEEWIEKELENFVKKLKAEKRENHKYYLDIVDNIGISKISQGAFTIAGDKIKEMRWLTFKDLIKFFREKYTTEGIVGFYGETDNAKEIAQYFKKILIEFKNFIYNKPYLLIIDEINRANLPSVLGELIYALEYRGEAVESMYDIDGNQKITLPPNLYIIGTMNTADRSVGHIDYAIRRRFAFINILPEIGVIKNEKAVVLFDDVAKLFGINFLSSDFKKEDVQLGHSYFIVKDNTELKMRLKYEIKPILLEYLKDGIFMENAAKEIEKLSC